MCKFISDQKKAGVLYSKFDFIISTKFFQAMCTVYTHSTRSIRGSMCNRPAAESQQRGGGCFAVPWDFFCLLTYIDKSLLCFLVSSITKITPAASDNRPVQALNIC